MADYRLATGGVVRARDGAYIPNNPANADWRDYLLWTRVGNVPDPPAPPPERPRNPEDTALLQALDAASSLPELVDALKVWLAARLS